MSFLYQPTLHFLALVGVLALIGLAGLHYIAQAQDEINADEDDWPADCGNYDSHTGRRKREITEPASDAVIQAAPGADKYSDIPPAWISPDSSAALAADGPRILRESDTRLVTTTNGHTAKQLQPVNGCAE